MLGAGGTTVSKKDGISQPSREDGITSLDRHSGVTCIPMGSSSQAGLPEEVTLQHSTVL